MDRVKMNKLGVIGFGNMSQAMVKGLLEASVLPAHEIIVSGRDREKLARNAAQFGLTAAADNREVAKTSETLILAVKPYQIAEVFHEIASDLESKLLISVAAGVGVDDFVSLGAHPDKVICMIPNTPISVGCGILIVEENAALCEDDLRKFKHLFENIAMIEFVPADKMGIAGSLAGCSPAFIAMFQEALGDAGVKYGMPRSTAYRLAAAVLEGTGRMAGRSGKHPGILKDQVCSPGGTTIRGVAALEEEGFRNAVIKAFDAICG